MIRLALHSDAASLIDIARSAITESCIADHVGDPLLLDAWLDNKTEEDAKQWIDSAESWIFVLEDNGTIRATASLSISGYVTLMFVDPVHQRSGYGSALIIYIEQFALENGIHSLSLNSTYGAQLFYKKHGYTPECESKFWKGIRCYPMRKCLI